jgi:hypothetical protein
LLLLILFTAPALITYQVLFHNIKTAMKSLGVLAFFTKVYDCFKRRENNVSNKMTNQTSSKYDDDDDDHHHHHHGDDTFRKEDERLGKRVGGSDIELTSVPFVHLNDKTSHDEFNPKNTPTSQCTVKQLPHLNAKQGEVSLSNHDINNNDIIRSSATVVSNDDKSESGSAVEVPFIIRKSAQEESDVFSDLALKYIEAHDDEASL